MSDAREPPPIAALCLGCRALLRAGERCELCKEEAAPLDRQRAALRKRLGIGGWLRGAGCALFVAVGASVGFWFLFSEAASWLRWLLAVAPVAAVPIGVVWFEIAGWLRPDPKEQLQPQPPDELPSHSGVVVEADGPVAAACLRMTCTWCTVTFERCETAGFWLEVDGDRLRVPPGRVRLVGKTSHWREVPPGEVAATLHPYLARLLRRRLRGFRTASGYEIHVGDRVSVSAPVEAVAGKGYRAEAIDHLVVRGPSPGGAPVVPWIASSETSNRELSRHVKEKRAYWGGA